MDFTSEVKFNAVAGTQYQIAIDGFFGDVGNFVLSWILEETLDQLPVIVTDPSSQVANRGANVTLTVNANGQNLTYQWRFKDADVPGATGSSYNIPSLQDKDVGLYSVVLSNGRWSVESLPADVLIHIPESGSTDAESAAQDKLGDLLSELTRQPAIGLAAVHRGAGLANVPALSHGIAFTQIFDTTGATKEAWEPNHCGEIGGASKGYLFQADDDGTVLVSTAGSSFTNVLAVYQAPDRDYKRMQVVTCDGQSGPDGSSRVRFEAQKDVLYYLAVDGVGAATGKVNLDFRMPIRMEPPTISQNGEIILSIHGLLVFAGCPRLGHRTPRTGHPQLVVFL